MHARTCIGHTGGSRKAEGFRQALLPAIGPDLHRKGKNARRWVARVYAGGGQYHVRNIGIADDIADADGVTVLTSGKRKRKRAAFAAIVPTCRASYTVRQAIADYVQEGRPAQKKT